jgi:hypothetical protein
MIPMKHSSIFRSRWMALLWAAGIIWFALDIAGTGDSKADGNKTEAEATDATGAPDKDEDVKALEGVIKGL